MTNPKSRPGASQISVGIVDDSLLMRKKLSAILNEAPDIMVVGSAANAAEARHLIKTCRPDVLTLDVQMPQMNGLAFLAELMRQRPMPVIMVAGNSNANTDTILTAIEAGAVDFVTKPDNREGWAVFPSTICCTIRIASAARIGAGRASIAKDPRIYKKNSTAPHQVGAASQPVSPYDLVAIGASTGGITAITRLLAELDKHMACPPIVIAQHMPAGFTARFADRLAETTGHDVAEACEGELLCPGMIRIAPGDRHLSIGQSAKPLICKISQDPPIENHRPSINALFTSVARSRGLRAIGVILTGMGHDGAEGLLAMRKAGAITFGEAQSSCTVYGMSSVARQIGAVQEELAVEEIAARLRILVACDQQKIH